MKKKRLCLGKKEVKSKLLLRIPDVVRSTGQYYLSRLVFCVLSSWNLLARGREDEIMCNLKLHLALRSSHRKPIRSCSEDTSAKTLRKNTETCSASTLFSKASPKSLASLRDSLPEKPNLYRYKELSDATAQFGSGRLGKSSVWKCVLRGKTVAITVRSQKRKIRDFSSGLREICNAHHASIVKLLGGCCEGDYIYLVYEYVQGSSLADCLRGSKVPGFTVLSSWISRMQIAVDVAQGLEYLHHYSKIDYNHNYIKSSSILVTEPSYKALICHVGASYLAGEYEARDIYETQGDSNSNMQAGALQRSNSMRITGTQGYMAPEYRTSGIVSQKTDIFALGIVLLELMSGHEPMRYVVDKSGRGITSIGLIETFNTVLLEVGSDRGTASLRSWMDPRLRDSFPVDCAERVARIAASCVDPDPGKRPDTKKVAGELSRVFILSEQWSEQMKANKGWLSSTFEAR